MVKKTLLAGLASLLFGSAVSAHEGHKCTHDTKDKPEPEIGSEGIEEIDLAAEGRTLQDYPNLRMASNIDAIGDQTPEFQAYIRDDVLPPVLSYFSNALRIPTPFYSNLKFSSSQATICGIPTPADVKRGIPVDFYYMIDASRDTSSNWVADSYSCFLTSNTKRPYVGRTVINTDEFPIATNNVLLHEKNVVCIMHELTHVLGFSTSVYKYYMYPNRTKITGHITSYTLDGESGGIMNIEPLTTRVRNFFGCPTLKGAYLEAGGGEGTAGSHFERRHFGFEFMTSGLIYQMQVSEFTLAMLEGSGWYAPDYNYADQYHFGQGQGCKFVTGICSYSIFDEFCVSSERGCTNVGRGGGACASDMRSNYCRYQHPRVEYDCENDGGISYARLPQAESYGRSAGSKCFMGTLTTAASASSTSFCFKPTCTGTGATTKLTVNVGSTTVQCLKEGNVSVAGFNGVLSCPDPVAFCSTVGSKKCPRGCMGRGQCVNGTCACNTGFKGTDCGLRAEYGL